MNSTNNGVKESSSIIPGSPAISSCSEGEPPHSPIESFMSANRSRSPIISSSLPTRGIIGAHHDIDNLRVLLQEVF